MCDGDGLLVWVVGVLVVAEAADVGFVMEEVAQEGEVGGSGTTILRGVLMDVLVGYDLLPEDRRHTSGWKGITPIRCGHRKWTSGYMESFNGQLIDLATTLVHATQQMVRLPGQDVGTFTSDSGAQVSAVRLQGNDKK